MQSYTNERITVLNLAHKNIESNKHYIIFLNSFIVRYNFIFIHTSKVKPKKKYVSIVTYKAIYNLIFKL